MGRLRLDRRIGGLAILVAALSLCLAARTAAAQPIADLRGDWEAVATVGTTTFPQTLHITSEDFTTGQIGGTDVGSDGTTFTLAGQISGANVTMTISDASYQSNTKATIVGTTPSLRLSGTFSDTNHSSGTFAASLSVPATISSPATAGSAVTPATAGSTVTPATATIGATANSQVAPVSNPPPADSGPTNELPLPLPLIAIGLGAVLLAGLGIAAATGLVPGVGLGGSATGSGGGQAGAGTDDASTPAPQQQTERWKIQQDVRPSISPMHQDTSANRPAPSKNSIDERRDAGGDPERGFGPAPTGTTPTSTTPADTTSPGSDIPTDTLPTA
jgi:hypothetical protein